MTERAHQSEVTNAQGRKTALIVACVLLALSAWNFYRHRPTVVIILGSLGVALLLIALLLPSLARRFHILWMRFAVALGYVNSRVLLSLMFYGVFTPYGLLSKIFGRDPLNRRGRGKDTYWIERKRTRQTKEQFERLF